MRVLTGVSFLVLGLFLSAASVADKGIAQPQEVSQYADLTSVLLEIKEAQGGFLEALDGVTDPAMIGAECDSLGARFETLTPALQSALDNHPELKAELPEGVKGTVEECVQAWVEWDTYMNATVLPLANEQSEIQALQDGFGRLNAAVFYMKYARNVMTLGRGS